MIAGDYHESVIGVDHSKSGVNGIREPDGFQQGLSGVAAMMSEVDHTSFDLEESH